MQDPLRRQPHIDTGTDGHVHTFLCRHAVGSMEDYVRAAVARGLACLTFLEHLEAGIRYPHRSWLEEADFDFYFTEGRRLQKAYGDRIVIRLGVELGYNPEALAVLEAKLRQYPWDSVGLSCHFFLHGDRHLNLLSRTPESLKELAGIGMDTVLRHYFAMLTDAVHQLDGTVLCHLDAALRHMPGLRFSQEHREQINTLLQAVGERGMALEINTSGFDYRGNPFPADWIITRALDLGIPLSAGSDAHRPEDVGRYFDRLPTYLQTL